MTQQSGIRSRSFYVACFGQISPECGNHMRDLLGRRRRGGENPDHRHRRLPARAPSGHTAAPAITDMNSRRLIAAPKVQGKGFS
jgi:hypothetical protein